MFIHILNAGLDVNKSMDNNMTPLLFACQRSLLNVVKFLIKKKANMECEMILGWRPIHAACYYADFNVIMYLINKGADLTHKIKKFNGNDSSYSCIDLIKLNNRLSEDDKNDLFDIIDDIISGRNDNDDDLFDEVYMKKSRWRKNKK
jgi:ankyrin repeat protein